MTPAPTPPHHPAGRTPAYVRIARELRDRAAALPAHSLLPSERELSQQFAVSRMTARQAVALLESEGHVYRRPPRGTFVAEPRVILRIGSFTEEITRLGRRPHAELLWAETRRAAKIVGGELGIGANARVHALQRLRRVDEEPLAIETTFIPADLAPNLLSHPLTGSIWRLLRETYDVAPLRATATIESIPLDKLASNRLGVRQSSAGIVLSRRTYDRTGRCIEYAEDTYRADRAAFEVTAEIPGR